MMTLSTMIFLLLSGGGDAPSRQTATLRSDGRELLIVETRTSSNSDGPMLERRFVADGEVFYRSRMQRKDMHWEWNVDIGHSLQKGRVLIARGSVEGVDAGNAVIWSGRTTHPICVPDLFAEIAVHHDARLRRGVTLICMAPVPKARKLAPLAVRRIADSANGRRRYSIGPGSLGMRLFVKTTIVEVSADGRSLLAQRGQFEASFAKKAFRYIEGDAMYPTPRALIPLPNVFLASGEAP